MSILRFHWIRFIGAVAALILAIVYLLGFEVQAMTGFIVIAVYAVILSVRLQQGTQPAICDLCRSRARMKVEYEHGFSNVRLMVKCPHCGRIVNTAGSAGGIRPGREEDC